MTEKVTKSFKSPYHILIWIGVLAAIFCGLIEWGYMSGAITKKHIPAPFGQWKLWLGMIPYAAWLVLTYIATKPKWFVQRYNVADMFKVHRIVGIVTVMLVCAHWYVYYGMAASKPMGWWSAYISLIAFLVAALLALFFLTPWFGKLETSISKKTAIWLHRLNLVALIAANIHAVVFRIGNFPPFYITLHVVTYAVVLYYLYWMIKKK